MSDKRTEGLNGGKWEAGRGWSGKRESGKRESMSEGAGAKERERRSGQGRREGSGIFGGAYAKNNKKRPPVEGCRKGVFTPTCQKRKCESREFSLPTQPSRTARGRGTEVRRLGLEGRRLEAGGNSTASVRKLGKAFPLRKAKYAPYEPQMARKRGEAPPSPPTRRSPERGGQGKSSFPARHPRFRRMAARS